MSQDDAVAPENVEEAPTEEPVKEETEEEKQRRLRAGKSFCPWALLLSRMRLILTWSVNHRETC
jgi:hypothetical protein